MPQRHNKKRKSKSSAITSRTRQEKRRERPATPDPLDPKYCHSSESEPEDYGDLNGQEKWEIDGVVDSHCGENDRMSYKIRWDKDDWQRADGTSEEWIPEPMANRSTHANLVKKYGAREFSKLDSLEASAFNTEFETGRYYSHMNSMAPGSSKNIWNQTGYLGVFGLGDAHVSRFYLTDPGFIPEDHEDDSDSDSNTGRQSPHRTRRVVPRRERTGSTSLGGTPHTGSQQVPPTALQELELKWNRVASAVGAAPITLTNQLDRSIPSLKQTFEYSEMDLRHRNSKAKDIHLGQIHLLAVTATSVISLIDVAVKHLRSTLVDLGVCIPLLMTAMENITSILKVSLLSVMWAAGAQQHVRIALFNALEVSTLRLSSSKSRAGVFARDKLLQPVKYWARLRVEMSSGQKAKFRDRNQFLFDMDSRHHKYTLDCWAIGNWTRFINHKCEPNLKVVSVCYDTLPDGRSLDSIITQLPRQEKG
ncbi:unnamed protein product [Rhizoctonia solani]|uniref:SET domain-containing protein n=1 Tax=Rhizoctonia solani TaxID=456999 RepID=A0A8H2XTV8_9AGAM|nr:unnamed protein product [Rhizoctonia solani]